MTYTLITDPGLKRKQYSELYYSLCYEKQKLERKKHQGLYLEDHHIIPKCMGGKKNRENMVLLTGREHFLAHKLLVGMFEGKEKRSMANALQRMCNKAKNNTGRIVLTALEYEKIRILIHDAISGENSPCFGINNYDRWVEKYGIEEANKRLEQKKKKISNSGKKRFENKDEREKQSKIVKKRFEDPEEREKISTAGIERWKDPILRKKQSETIKKSYEDPEIRKKCLKSGSENGMHGKSLLDVWTEKYGIEEANRRNEEKKAKTSKTLKKRFEDPEEREKISGALKRMWEEPGRKEKQGEIVRKRLENSVEREKHSKAIKKSYENPEIRKKCSRHGKENGMHGKSLLDVWTEKYGIEEAIKRNEARKDKTSKTFANKKRTS